MSHVINSDLSGQQENNQKDFLEKVRQRASELDTAYIPPETKKISEEERAEIDAAVVEELNLKLAIVHTNTTHILIEKGRHQFVLDSKASLLTLYENNTVDIGGIATSKTKIWLKSPNRRTFHDIVFNPKVTGHYEDKYNIWTGYAMSPVQGECSLFWDHVKNIICSGNAIYYLYIRKWLAHLIQKPWIIGAALVLRGKQGTGKGAFVNALGSLLGPHYAPLASLDHVLGRFNSHLKNAILIFADEAVWCGQRKELGMLKALITEPKLFIEAKGKDGYWVDNYKHLIVSSNENWAVPLDPDDRRFFVLDISSERKEDVEYFNAFYHQLDHGGCEALLYDLMHEDLNGFDPKIMPENYLGFDMKLQSASSIDRFIYESLREGYWDHHRSDPFHIFNLITTKEFGACYRSWCHTEEQSIQGSNIVGRRLGELFSNLKTVRPRHDNPDRHTIYDFPPLEECRRNFEQLYKQNAKYGSGHSGQGGHSKIEICAQNCMFSGHGTERSYAFVQNFRFYYDHYDQEKNMNILELAWEVGLQPKRVAATNGGEYHSPCPRCAGKDRFIIWSATNRYYCRRCEAKGDLIQFCRDFMGLGFKEACQKVGVYPKLSARLREVAKPLFQPQIASIPSQAWQDSAGRVMKIKIRRHQWKEGDRLPKYAEVAGSMTSPSLFGVQEKVIVIVEAELDALLIKQEAGDVCSCMALGGASKRPDKASHEALLRASLIFVCFGF